MPNLPAWYTGNRDPAITEVITSGDTPVDLAGKTVKFKMRLLNSSTLKVDAAATIVSASSTLTGAHVLPTSTLTLASTTAFNDSGAVSLGGQYVFYTGKTATTLLGCTGGTGTIAGATTVTQIGTVTYAWLAADVDTAGNYLVWWEVTTTASGKTQDVGEAFVEFLPHAPVSREYVELEEFKKTIALDGLTFADVDVKKVLAAAARKIDELTGRRFWTDADALQVRFYSPWSRDLLMVDDIVTITSLKTDDGGDGTFENTWVLNTDYTREPLNAATENPVEPWTLLRRHPTGNFYFPTWYPRSVELTGKFGWPAVPEPINLATKMLAHRYLKRVRESPTGVAGFGLDGAVVRFQTVDSDVMDLVGDFSRRVLVA